ncbi:metal ABC transporter solute-binding protein, Zn/Mn family [Clostridium estertheticum]|uniref:metal ABC transporter solute-binding protein, Zn/Mn family n=1 Tax=Clostridium estertheticum TaxID=238834 RepID=UPI001CF383B6|nr:zinc ABC transporter substrate-binding protein [Clostridium estertheticum]MCB2359061.1 zinc ABC transporter substrate-binding protein [Clostridium estertheticum]
MKKIIRMMLLTCIIFTLVGCSKSTLSIKEEATGTVKSDKSKLQVVVSFNPLKEFAEAVGKDKVQVKVVVPEGVEPHDFEPKIKDMKSISDADLFVYSGFGMETWVSKTLSAIDNKNLVVVDSSLGINPIKSQGDEVQEHGQFDPHIWLSLKDAKIQTKNIKDAMVKADKKNKVYYEKNYEEFSKKLDKLYSEYNLKFAGIKNKNFVTGHAAFGYLCRDFGLIQNSVEDVFAGGEPTPQKLKKIVELSKKYGVKVIFMEELASPRVSETLAKEVGAKVQKIYTIESSEDNKGYLESMEANLSEIYDSLK